MIANLDSLQQAVDELLGRASGPLHFRLLMQPAVAAFLAVKAGLKDAREGQPAFLWEVVTNSDERHRLLQSAWKDVGKVFLLALHAIRPLQTLIVALVLALVPYVLLRGPVTRLARRGRGTSGGSSYGGTSPTG
jgi:hypothetical protein